MVLELEEQSREVGSTLREPGNTRASPADEHCESAMGCAKDTWRIAEIGIEVSQTTGARCMVRRRKPPSQTWRTFLENHVKQLVSTDFLVVPTVSFRVLYVFVVLGHDRRRAIHFNVTAHPTAE
jgi:hypothetical protein